MRIHQIIFLLFVSGLAYAQDTTMLPISSISEYEIENIIVSATRTKRQLSSLPLKSDIISKESIENSNSVRLGDILNEQTGLVSVSDFGGGEGLQLQGMDSEYTLILIDGVPLIGRSAGTLDLNRISLNNVEQIEIVKGASSCLYGNEALAGVINIITEKPKSGWRTELNGQYGTFSTADLNLNLSHQMERVGFMASANRFSSQGYNLFDNDDTPTVSPFESFTSQLRFSYDPSESTSITLSNRYFTQDQELNVIEGEGNAKIRELNNHIKVTHIFDEKWNVEGEFYHTNYITKEILESNAEAIELSTFDQTMIRPEMRLLYQVDKKSNALLGFGLTHETLQRTSFLINPNFNAPYIYAQYDSEPIKSWNMILGLRYDMHNAYSSQLSPKLALRKTISDKLTARGSIGYGFKAPAFRQLYFDFSNSTVGYTVLGYNAVQTRLPQLQQEGTIINLSVPLSEFSGQLSPESSISINMGLDYYISSDLEIKMNVFRNEIDNLIDTRVIARQSNGQNVFSYYNVAAVTTQGIELDARYGGFSHIILTGGYQLLYAYDKDAKTAFNNGEVYGRKSSSSPAFVMSASDYIGLYNRSRHMANLKLEYTFPRAGWNMNLRGTYRSRYGLSDTNGNTYLDKYDDLVSGYMIWDTALNYTGGQLYKIGLGINNILGFTDGLNIPNIPGRTYYANFHISIN